jgi:hypothetical protein
MRVVWAFAIVVATICSKIIGRQPLHERPCWLNR